MNPPFFSVDEVHSFSHPIYFSRHTSSWENYSHESKRWPEIHGRSIPTDFEASFLLYWDQPAGSVPIFISTHVGEKRILFFCAADVPVTDDLDHSGGHFCYGTMSAVWYPFENIWRNENLWELRSLWSWVASEYSKLWVSVANLWAQLRWFFKSYKPFKTGYQLSDSLLSSSMSFCLFNWY